MVLEPADAKGVSVPVNTKRNASLFDYLPTVAGFFADAHDLLEQGCWTGEVSLRQHDRKRRYRRRLWVQRGWHPFEWGNWGKGERFFADERVPSGVLECALFRPHHWLDLDQVADFVDWFDPLSARSALKPLTAFYVSEPPPDRDAAGMHEEHVAYRARMKDFLEEELRPSELPGGDALALKTFAKLLPHQDDPDPPRTGPPGYGMDFVRELHRRLEKRGIVETDTQGVLETRKIRKELIPAEVRHLVFAYLPELNAYDIATGFFVEAMTFLGNATTGRIDDLGEHDLLASVLEFEAIIRGHLGGASNRAKTLDATSDLLLRVVYGGSRPNLSNPPDYSKYLKAASLVVDHGFDERRVARALGLKGARSGSGDPVASEEERVRHYVDEGRKIRDAIPQRMWDGGAPSRPGR